MARAKVVIVTGASRGIGLAVSQHLIQSAHNVVLVARSQIPLETLKKKHPEQVDYVAGDLTDPNLPSQVTDLAMKRFGKIDGLVMNHGVISPMSRLENSSIQDWKRLYDINVFSSLALVSLAVAELRKAKGCVAWVSTGAATNAYVSWAAYGSSKAALEALSTHLALEEPDVCSVAILPGRVDTEVQREIREVGKATMDDKDHQSFVDSFKQGTLNRPEHVGGAIARLVVKPRRELSGKSFRLTAPELAEYVKA